VETRLGPTEPSEILDAIIGAITLGDVDRGRGRKAL